MKTIPHQHSNRLDNEHPAGDRFARAVEYSVAIFLTAAAIAMHIRYFLDAGGLWRDEITSVNLAGSPTFHDVLANLHHDSFPILWLLVVRFWEAIGVGASDRGMRLLGLLIGVAALATLWRNARRFGLTAPVVSLALLGSTSSVICYGDSIRGYGLGIFLGLMAMGFIWEMTRKETRGAFILALITALLSVHALFYNSVLLLASCCGAFAVMLPKHQWKRSARVLLVGAICACSMLAYLPVVHRELGYKMFQIPQTIASIFHSARQSIEFEREGGIAPGSSPVLWCIAIGSAMLLAIISLSLGRANTASSSRRDAAIFCGVNLVVGVIAYAAFLKVLSYRLPSWYFLAAIGMVAGCTDGLIAVVTSRAIRVLFAVYAVGFALYAAIPLWENTGVRRTNVDLIAAEVQRFSEKGDVVVMAPWNIGCTFVRYYHGPARITAIPPVSVFDYQRFDLLLKFMTDRNAMDPLIRELAQTLSEGHRVWVVGDHDFPSIPPESPYFQQGPDPVYGWITPYYQKSWQDEVFYALRHHSDELIFLPVTSDRPVSHLEMSWLSVVQGWND